MEEDDRILLAGVEIYRLHHPAVQFHTFGSGERESLALAPIILPCLFEQLLVVFQCLDKLALVAAYGEDIRMAVAAPGIDEIAVIAREVSRVGTSRIGKALHLSVLMSHVNLAVVRIELSSLEITSPVFSSIP